MPAYDVVKHDLTTSSSVFDWENAEPLPLPVVRKAQAENIVKVMGEQPVTTLVTKTERKSAPYQSVGKMGLIIGEKGYAGSGWIVAPRAFITAGHCVYYEKLGGWLTEGVFAPHYDVDDTGWEYTITTVYTLKGWIESRSTDHRYDMAACVVSGAEDWDEPPLAFDRGPADDYIAIGYPSIPIPGYNFNGEHMWKSVGNHERGGVDTGLWWAENNLTNGSSGGPWCATGSYEVCGLNSFRRDDLNLMASPIFEEGFDNLYNAVKNL